MDTPKIECVIIEYKKPKADWLGAVVRLSIVSAIFIVCLNFIEIIYSKRGLFMTEIITQIGTTAAIIAGIAAAITGLIAGLYGKKKNIIHLALAGLLLNGVMIAMGFVKNPFFEKMQTEAKTVTLSSGHKIITEDWVSKEKNEQQGDIIHLGDDNFDKTVNSSSGVVLVDFWASWCKPCRMMGPIIEGLAVQYKDKAKVCKLNVDESKKTSKRFGIRYLPTIILFKNGHEYERWTGFTGSSEINSALEKRIE